MNPNADYEQSLRDFLGPEAYDQKLQQYQQSVLHRQRRDALRQQASTWLIRFAMLSLMVAAVWHLLGA